MDQELERAALVALLRRGDRSWPELTDQVETVGSARDVLESALDASGQGALFATEPAVDLESIAAEIAAWEREGMRLVTILDEDYPLCLRLVHQRPPFLFLRGNHMENDLRVAVVGTRNPTPEGIAHARAIAGGLAERGVTVVSGLAAGIDTAAHGTALAVGGRTVAVIGTGLRRSYPAQNARLQQEIADSGLVISQFWPDSPPSKASFPMRNAVMSGYSLATVVVEAAYRSGARMQARLALEHGRRVFLMRSLMTHEWAREYAARPNTSVIDTADDIFNVLDSLVPTTGELTWA
ncbi:nucleotide-binding protein [Streptomyces davaonensis JCM 4913]|uniref:Nucleotide-binding protein n=1 Tax=Streptomyces davaonensis (strain DSM 101723 / JCM 4913 / KCC S-0913 / 768) TaxID=1214101 RepID=K4R834_STRDJ|nr:DNA-processing protein DprA [Streptomyces davaonensis]CCK28834.1 nucleotide-binding protein [Streptomyces davaonensis JCM 4913]